MRRVIAHEGHRLKNQNTLVYAAIYYPKYDFIRLLSATPMSNSSVDLAAIMDRLLKRGDLPGMTDWTEMPEKGGRQQMIGFIESLETQDHRLFDSRM